MDTCVSRRGSLGGFLAKPDWNEPLRQFHDAHYVWNDLLGFTSGVLDNFPVADSSGAISCASARIEVPTASSSTDNALYVQ
jgi:hypothetical protein